MSGRLVIGVTGNIASGKSTVLGMLGDLGFVTIDADRVYHELIAPGSALNDRLVAEFGPAIRTTDGAIDRAALRGIVFSDPDALGRLDALTHPAIVREIGARVAAMPDANIAIDAVKLNSGGLGSLCDRIWVVTVPEDVQLQRLVARNAISGEEARKRIAAQPSLEGRLAIANAVIDNAGSHDETREQVMRALAGAGWTAGA